MGRLDGKVNLSANSFNTIVLALVAYVIGVLIVVFDILFQDADMPEF